jgi:hypothetical protein
MLNSTKGKVNEKGRILLLEPIEKDYKQLVGVSYAKLHFGNMKKMKLPPAERN